LPNIDQVAQRGWGSTIKLQVLGGTIIGLSKKQPLFVRRLSIFLSFKSLKNLGILPEKNFWRELATGPPTSSTPYNPQTQTLDLPSISTLVSFYHACLGFPVKQTWLDAIKAGNCDTFDGHTYSNVAR
jgi:hypothetical protein